MTLKITKKNAVKSLSLVYKLQMDKELASLLYVSLDQDFYFF